MKNEMAILGVEGDVKMLWSADNTDEVAAAQKTFDDLKKKGFLAYKVVGKDGAKGEQLLKFDPTAERIIMSPPMVGG